MNLKKKPLHLVDCGKMLVNLEMVNYMKNIFVINYHIRSELGKNAIERPVVLLTICTKLYCVNLVKISGKVGTPSLNKKN